MSIVSLQVLCFFYSELLKSRNLQVSSFEKFSGGVGWWGGGVVCLIIVSTPGPGFVMIKARFGQVDDEVGHALFGQVGDLVGQFGQGQGQELDKIALQIG